MIDVFIDNDEEIWKDIPGYDGVYQVSNLGRVKSFKHGKTRIMKSCDNSRGYLAIQLQKDGITKHHNIHRLVASAFFGQSDKQINHKDFDRSNNKLENLEYCTQKENSKHALDNGRKGIFRTGDVIGSNNKNSKLKDNDILIIRTIRKVSDITNTQIAKLFDVSQSTIGAILKSRTWKHI